MSLPLIHELMKLFSYGILSPQFSWRIIDFSSGRLSLGQLFIWEFVNDLAVNWNLFGLIAEPLVILYTRRNNAVDTTISQNGLGWVSTALIVSAPLLDKLVNISRNRVKLSVPSGTILSTSMTNVDLWKLNWKTSEILTKETNFSPNDDLCQHNYVS